MHEIDDSDAELARRFLLGHLSAEDTARFETRMLADEQMFEVVQAVRSELFDEYVRGTLGAEERQTLASRFEQKRNRLLVAKALSQKPPVSRARRGGVWRWAAAAAVLLAVAGITLWQRSTATSPATNPATSNAPIVVTETRTSDAPRPLAPEKIAALTVALATTRDDTAPASLELGAETTSIALTIRLHPEDRYAAYRVDISRMDGGAAWQGNATMLEPGEIAVKIPSSQFPSGEYLIIVNGLNDRGETEDLGDQTLHITRLP
ncbi:MAG TPA: hypothetical protein VGQ76_04325 [Thermoanaerobaculia bacterium]|nr:hypothetical protein [Thermoanaerobaculia bacterium]